METISAYRVCVYVPCDFMEEFINAISPYIPSFLGRYDHVCWWSEAGVEQFRRVGSEKIEKKPSCRVEISLPDDDTVLQRFISDRVVPNHPWDEPVITITKQKIVNNVL